MSKIVTVFGATGSQGSGVVAALAQNPDWKVRAVTRNTETAKAKLLRTQGVEVVAANFEDPSSLAKAVEAAHAVFAVTDYWQYIECHGHIEAGNIESRLGISLANILAKSSTLEHFIWSTLPAATPETRGRVLLPHWNAKAEVDQYIKTKLPDLAAKTTFLWVGFYADNLMKFDQLTPLPFGSSGKHLLLQPCSADTLIPVTGCVSKNTGIFVGAILARPDVSLPSEYAVVHSAAMTFPEILQIWEKATGKKVVYIPTTTEDYNALWGEKFGQEVSLQYEYMANVPDAMIGEPEVLSKSDLGITSLGSISDTFREEAIEAGNS